MDAAEALLAHHSPEALTTRKVAEAANVPIGSVYRYFENMDDLLEALFDHINQGTIETLQTADKASDWPTLLNHTFVHLKAMHAAHPHYGPLMAYVNRGGRRSDAIFTALERLLSEGAPGLPAPLIITMSQTVILMLEGVESRLHFFGPIKREALLDEVHIAIRAYLSSHLDRAV
jgi:AcrR family transcriptional regulator